MIDVLPVNPFVGSISARQGAAEALRLLLLGLTANAGGGTAADRGVRLLEVFTRWPRVNEREPPCASITDVTTTEDEDDCDTEYPDAAFSESMGATLTLTESSGVFAIDLWTEDDAERKGFEVALPAIFRGQDFAHHVVVDAPAETLPAAWRETHRLKVRLTLRQQLHAVDDGAAAENNEYRANARVEWDAEVAVARPIERFVHVVNRGGVVGAGGLEDDSDDEEG